ncbi:MAG: alpha/beta hydrolase [Halioglobus sp.]|nr:alpha/beta hydrolase [Halioglobus sp.]
MGSVICGSGNVAPAKISYRQVGEGPDVILIHGLAANCAFWQMDLLLPLSAKHRVTVYDLRGHGYSGMTESGYRPSDMADDLLSLMDQLGIGKATIVGHSFGGAVALRFIEKYPARVENLVLADTRVHAIQPTNYARDWPNAAEALPRLHALGLDIPDDERDSGIWLLEQLAKPEWRSERHKLKGSPLYMPFAPFGGGTRSANKWLKLLKTTKARQEISFIDGPTADQISQISQPVMVYYGSHSTLQDSFRGLQKLLPNCSAVIAPKAGHFFPLSQPLAFGTEVAAFLASTESAKSVIRIHSDAATTYGRVREAVAAESK